MKYFPVIQCSQNPVRARSSETSVKQKLLRGLGLRLTYPPFPITRPGVQGARASSNNLSEALSKVFDKLNVDRIISSLRGYQQEWFDTVHIKKITMIRKMELN